jgi:hypothetical protein
MNASVINQIKPKHSLETTHIKQTETFRAHNAHVRLHGEIFNVNTDGRQ